MKFVSPILYAAGLFPVLVTVWRVLTFVENNIGFGDYVPGIGLDNFTTIYFNGDIVAVATIVLAGLIVFGALSQSLVRLERIQEPTILDHLRHCSLLYSGILFMGLILFISYESQAGGLGYALGLVVLVIGAYAASIDASILFLNRRRLNRVEHGGAR